MTRRRRALFLLLAIVSIGAVGLTLALVGRYFIGATRDGRLAALDIRAAQLAASGVDWVATHPRPADAFKPGETRSLDVTALLPPGATGKLEIAPDATGEALRVTAVVRRGRLAATVHADCPSSGGR
ncbi:MAG: hypothetical protein ACE5E1_01200 [Phycisphaerae bacterium]